MTTLPVAAVSTEERLQRLERRVDKITELTLQIDALRDENRNLRGQIERQQYLIETLQRKQRDLYQDIDQRLSRLNGSPQTPLAAGTGTTAPPGDGKPSSDVRTPDRSGPTQRATNIAQERAEYRAAYDLLRPEQRRYQDAIKAFRSFLQKYPYSKLADNAQYWLAEASYVTQDNAVALAEFKKVVDKYPNSPKVPGALLKIGYLQHVGGDIAAARKTLRKVVKDYPATSAATMAQQRLQQIEREAR